MNIEPIEKVQTYYEYYLESRSTATTAKKFKKCTKYLAKYFRHYGFDYPIKEFNKKNQYNSNYFENIDTEAKAYFLGFIFADGCIYVRKRKNRIEKTFRMNLAETDKEVLLMLKKEIEFNGELYFIEGKEFTSPINNKNYTRKDQYAIFISSDEFVSNIMKWGLENRKTYMDLKLPKISDELMRHFIRGYFDGDGCIYKNSVLITNKTKTLLEDIQNHLTSKFNLPFGSIALTSRQAYIWKLTANSNIFLDYIYKDCNYFLSRKNPFGPIKIP